MRSIRFGIVIFCSVAILAVAFPALVTADAVPNDSTAGASSGLLAATPEASTTPVVQFVPTKRTWWQAAPELDQQTGDCGVAVNYCPAMVIITPRSRTSIYWRGQELTPYAMFRSRTNPNIYSYAGLNALRDGKIKLTLEFTSSTTWKATQELVLRREPQCVHKLVFNGTFLPR
ncbi:MAG: hypothetical protein ABI947_09565 [Chloroflexota bacterium]